MCKIHILLSASLILFLSACHKDNTRTPLPDGSVVFQQTADTLVMPLSVLTDSTIVVDLIAELSGKAASTGDHYVGFSIDTTKLGDYTAKYGDAQLLPSVNYFLYRAMTKIPAGASVSDSGQLNIFGETTLRGYTTYVLPVVLHTVDGKPDGAASNQVLYLVFKTGKPAFIPKDGWTIAACSSFTTNPPAGVIDNDENGTYWASSPTAAMPQYVTINFNSTITFSAVVYFYPAALTYPTYGGYPTSVKVETSMDGTTWTYNGTYAGNLVNNMQTISTGTTTAQYLRFTSLACVPFAGVFNCVLISGIKLLP